MDATPDWPPAPSAAPSEPRAWRFRSSDLFARVPEDRQAQVGRPAIWFFIWPAMILGFGLLGGLVAGLIYGFQVGMGVVADTGGEDLMWYLHPMIAVANLALLIFFWSWSSRRGMAGAVMDFRARSWWRETGFGLLMLIVTIYAGGTLVTWLMQQIQQPVTPENIVPPEAGLGLFLIALPGIVIIGPIIEELIFRGWMLPALKQRGMGWIGALIVSSLAFGLLHVFAGPASIAYTAVLGFTAGLTRILSGRLWGPVLLHVLNNLFAISVPQFLVTPPV